MRALLKSLVPVFTPPFSGLALVVILYIAWAHLVYPHNDVIRGNLPDPDDYMYLTQVLDWLQGQSWYDNVQHRLNPPYGVPIHFSRFVQIPLAAGILFFEKCGLPPRGAALVTALLEPLFLLGACLSVLRYVAARFISVSWAGASAYIALFSIGLLYEFMPGHVDHHGLVIILILASIGCVLHLIDEPHNSKYGIFAGLLLSITLMVALECLPWVLLLSLFLGLWSLKHGSRAIRSGLLFALTLFIGTSICLLLTKSPSTLFNFDILTFSLVYVFLALAILIPFLVTMPIATLSPIIRHSVGLSTALVSAFVFLHYFPSLLRGPYGDIDPQLVPILLNSVEEARPLLHSPESFPHMINFMGMGFIAISVSLVFLAYANGKEKEKWIVLSSFLFTSLILTLFYQYRFMGMEAALAVVPLTVFLQRGWVSIGQFYNGKTKIFFRIALVLLVGPLPSLFIPALTGTRHFDTELFLFPVDPGRSLCDTAKLERFLRNPQGLGAHPLLILSTMEMGPELLFRTDDTVLAAPFHMNVTGNLDAARFLSTPYPDEAKNIAERRKVDLIVICRAVPNTYLSGNSKEPSFVEQIFKGSIPSWLEAVPAPNIDNFVIYRVKI